MFFDMHVHEKTYSSDSQLSLEQIVIEAKACGLDGIVITDHDTVGLRSQAKRLSARHNLHIFVGVEVLTLQGDLLVLGVDDIPKGHLDAQHLIDDINARGGATIAAHPFRNNGRGLGETIRSLSGLTAVEGYNGRTKAHHNLRAAQLAESLGLPVTGGSDAHLPGEVGGVKTWIDASIKEERDLIEALKAGKCYVAPLAHETVVYSKASAYGEASA